MSEGTPKTLREALEREMCMGPASTFLDRAEAAVKDYASQKFTILLMTGRSREEQKILTDLWTLIFGERK